MNTIQPKADSKINQDQKKASGGELPQKQVVKEKMTAAMAKVMEYRDLMNASRTKILAKDLSCVAYIYTDIKGRYCVVAYSGRSKKPAFHHCYREKNGRTEKVKTWMKEVISRKAAKKTETSKRLLKVGDVVNTCWGYEQTNVEYFMVTKLIGKASVELVEIGCENLPTEDMQGRCIPDKNNIIGDPIRRRVIGDRVKICNVRSASLKTTKLVAGCEVYTPDSWSSYH